MLDMCVERENGLPLISLRSQKDITLEVKVTNLKGDDAHEASLVASFPASLTYSAHVNVSLSFFDNLTPTHTHTHTLTD